MKSKVWDEEADYVIVGSGASGASVARTLVQAGEAPLILEEGSWHQTNNFRSDSLSTSLNLFRDRGWQVARGESVIPVLEGRCVGGSTVINGAILHRLPQKVYDEWCVAQPEISNTFRYDDIDLKADEIEKSLQVKSNLAPILASLPLSKALNKLNWSYQPMLRNAPDCQSSGRCLQGCPTGAKLSMEKSFIPEAIGKGARLISEAKVVKILFESDKAVGVLCQLKNRSKKIRAVKAVILCAGVTQSPLILWRSQLKKSLRGIGRNFQCHLSVGLSALFDRDVRELQGPPQGVEVFRKHDVKLATQLLPRELIYSRAAVFGKRLSNLLKKHRYASSWMASIRSKATGLVAPGFTGTRISFNPSPRDLYDVRNSLKEISVLLFELGAKTVFLGVHGSRQTIRELDSTDSIKLIEGLSLSSKNYFLSVGHMFGTCKMGPKADGGVVNPLGKVHGIEQLYVMDASIFPSNLGVNPQHSIMSLSSVLAERLVDKA